jgi:antitoxin (DNA-binding transcriptional repressor) of toxin-antitoxin stability system
MATTIGLFEAKTKLSELIDRIEGGEEFIITRRGKIVARMSPPERHDASSQADKEKAIQAIIERGRRLVKKHRIKATSDDHDEFLYGEDGLPR